MRGWLKCFGTVGALAELLWGGQALAWQYREARDQLSLSPTQHAATSMDQTFRYFADLRCTNATDLRLAYTVPHEISDDQLVDLRRRGGKLIVYLAPVDYTPHAIDAEFARATDGRLVIIARGQSLIDLVPKLAGDRNAPVQLSLQLPGREDYAFSSIMQGGLVMPMHYMAKSCGIPR